MATIVDSNTTAQSVEKITPWSSARIKEEKVGKAEIPLSETRLDQEGGGASGPTPPPQNSTQKK